MIAELMLHVCWSFSCTSLQKWSLISSTHQIEQPRISTSFLSPEVSSSPARHPRHETLSFLLKCFCARHPRACSLTVLQCLHQSIGVPQRSKIDESLGNPIVSKHGEPIDVDDVSLSSGLHDAPEVCHQDLSSFVE